MCEGTAPRSFDGKHRAATATASGPETRTMASAACPRPVAMAAMVEVALPDNLPFEARLHYAREARLRAAAVTIAPVEGTP